MARQNTGSVQFKPRLKYQFIALVLVGLLVPVILVFVFQVNFAIRENKESSQLVTAKTAEQISETLDGMHQILYNTSDIFANDENILTALNRDYADNISLKRASMAQIKNRFLEMDVFNPVFSIGAIYTAEGQLFNFYTGPAVRQDGLTYAFDDPVSDEVAGWLDGFSIDTQDKLAILHWYGLQPNLFQKEVTGDARRDNILLGSRRTFHRHLGNYLNTHIFIIPEQEIFNQYSSYLREEGQQVFILDEEKRVISSTEVAYLEGQTMDPALLAQLAAHGAGSFSVHTGGAEQLVSYTCSEKTGWYSVVVTPAQTVTEPFWTLFKNMLAAFVVLIACFLVGMVVFSQHISTPLWGMIQSMRQVQKGNFVPAPANNYKNEIGQITYYYNRMVSRLKKLIEDEYEYERHSKELETRVLMGQINPHFMYNTLETIVWKANQAKRPDIARIASQLGHLLRLSVKIDTLTIPLAQEIEQTGLYIEIQKMRYKDRLDFEIMPFDEGLNSLQVLRLILQPSVENAIVHAMRPDSTPLHIRVQVAAEADKLTIQVRDDGIGMEPARLTEVLEYIRGKGKAEKFLTSGTGIGIRNIHERIVLYFGESYGVDMVSTPNVGTTIRITMPILPTGDAAPK